MSDAELIALATKAFGNAPDTFSPLTDDGDALRLAVKLRLDIDHHQFSVNVWDGYIGTGRIPSGDDPYAATRRSIVRAAAEIGKEMQ